MNNLVCLIGHGAVVHDDGIYFATPNPARALERLVAEFGNVPLADLIAQARNLCVYEWPLIPELAHLRFRRMPDDQETQILNLISQARKDLAGAFLGDKDAMWRFVSIVYYWAANYGDEKAQAKYLREIRQYGKSAIDKPEN